MDARPPPYRFVPQADQLVAFFKAYQDERRALGIGTTIYHVSPRQRIDAVEIILGLNAVGGWRRVDGEGPKALWLRYLRPALAETRESAAALTALMEHRELPGRFVPPFAEIAPEPKPPKPEPPRPPEPPPTAAWRLAMRARLERLRAAMTVPRVSTALVIVVLVVGGIVLSRVKSELHPHVDIVPPRLPTVDLSPSPAPLAGQASAASREANVAYQAAADIIAAAVVQQGDALTPRRLATFLAGTSDSVDEPAVFLAAMLGRWPMPPDTAIPLVAPEFRALRECAAAAASVESALPVDAFEPLVQASATPTAWARLPTDTRPAAAAPVMATWPAWLQGLAFLPLVPLSIWAFATLPRALRAGLRNPTGRATGTPVVLPVALLIATAVRPPRYLSRRLSEREPFPGRRLNADRTVRATLAAGGFPTLVMRPALRTTDFVFLIARRHRHDHERDRVLRLVDALKRGGVPLFTYDYDPDPRSIFPVSDPNDTRPGPSRDPPRLDLRALRELHGDARLVLITDGRELVDYFTQRPLRFLDGLRNWPRRMLLTPVPVADWGEREMNLSRALDARIGRATEEGFYDLAYVFEPRPLHLHRDALKQASRQDGTVAQIFNWLVMAERLVRPEAVAARPRGIRFDDAALVSDAEPPQDAQAACLAALREWLGRPGYLWLAACAAYPQTRFNITIYLGLALTFRTRSGEQPLFGERLLAHLTALPWFQNGRMPPWLRRALIGSLSEGARERVRVAIDKMLAGKPPTAQKDARDTALTIWRPEDRALDLPPDAVLADLMVTRRSDLVPILTGRLFADVFRAPLYRAFGQRLLALGLTLVWCVVAWWLWPGTRDGPHAPGAWLPLAAMVAATLVLGALALLTLRAIGRSRMRQGTAAEASPVAARTRPTSPEATSPPGPAAPPVEGIEPDRPPSPSEPPLTEASSQPQAFETSQAPAIETEFGSEPDKTAPSDPDRPGTEEPPSPDPEDSPFEADDDAQKGEPSP